MSNLPVLPIIRAAFLRLLRNPAQAFRIALPYFFLMLALAVVSTLFEPIDWTKPDFVGVLTTLVLSAADLVVYSWMAIAWHRVTLIGFSVDGGAFQATLGPRQWRFIGYSLLIYLAVAALLLSAALSYLAPLLGAFVNLALAGITVVLVLRCSLVFPATAVDHATSLALSWRQTAGNFAPLLLINLALLVPVFIPIAVLDWTLGSLFEGTGVMATLAVQAIVIPVEIAATFVFISALSYIYRCLTDHPDPLALTD